MGVKSLGRKLLTTIFAAAILAIPAPLSDIDAHASYPVDTPEEQLHDGISSIFNYNALESDISLRCDDKTILRSQRAEKPRSRNTEIQGKSSQGDLFLPSLVHRSPRLTEDNQNKVREILDTIPAHQKDLFFTNGGTWVFTEHTLVEALPEYDNHSKTDPDTGDVSYPYYESYVGVYIHGEKRVYVTFNLADVSVFKQDNQIIKSIGYRPPRNDLTGTAHHEIGHFFNYLIAERYMQLQTPDGQTAGSVSESAQFDEAYKADVQDLLQKSKDDPDLDLTRLSYYLTEEYEQTQLGGDHETLSRAKSEALAELWSEISGYGDNNIRDIFPRSYLVLTDIDLELQKAYEAKGQSCILTNSGIAFDLPSI